MRGSGGELHWYINIFVCNRFRLTKASTKACVDAVLRRRML